MRQKENMEAENLINNSKRLHQQTRQHTTSNFPEIFPDVTKHDKRPMSDDDRRATKKSLVILLAIFFCSSIAMFYVYLMFPELDEYAIAQRNSLPTS